MPIINSVLGFLLFASVFFIAGLTTAAVFKYHGREIPNPHQIVQEMVELERITPKVYAVLRSKALATSVIAYCEARYVVSQNLEERERIEELSVFAEDFVRNTPKRFWHALHTFNSNSQIMIDFTFDCKELRQSFTDLLSLA